MKKYNTTILVVDDDKDDLFLIERAFKAIGVRSPIQAINGGEEAIRYMRGEGKYSDREKFPFPTFITTDLKMPGMDGFAVMQCLRDHVDWSAVPTVVLSSSSDPDDIKMAYSLGASSYHVKPSSSENLRHQLKVLHEYWLTCEIPEVDAQGRSMTTNSEGKLGERFRSKPVDPFTEDA